MREGNDKKVYKEMNGLDKKGIDRINLTKFSLGTAAYFK